jgi:hypothetical protein
MKTKLIDTKFRPCLLCRALVWCEKPGKCDDCKAALSHIYFLHQQGCNAKLTDEQAAEVDSRVERYAERASAKLPLVA